MHALLLRLAMDKDNIVVFLVGVHFVLVFLHLVHGIGVLTLGHLAVVVIVESVEDHGRAHGVHLVLRRLLLRLCLLWSLETFTLQVLPEVSLSLVVRAAAFFVVFGGATKTALATTRTTRVLVAVAFRPSFFAVRLFAAISFAAFAFVLFPFTGLSVMLEPCLKVVRDLIGNLFTHTFELSYINATVVIDINRFEFVLELVLKVLWNIGLGTLGFLVWVTFFFLWFCTWLFVVFVMILVI